MRVRSRWAITIAAALTLPLLPSLAAGPAAAAGTGDQALWGYDPQYTSDNTAETSVTAADVASLQPAWSAGQPTNGLRPLVAGGRVFFGCSDGTCALDERTGKELWALNDGGLPEGVVNGVVYGVNPASGNTVKGIDAATGHELWSFQPPGNSLVFADPEPNGIFYVGTGPAGWIYAVSESTRSILWSYQVNPPDPNGVYGTVAGFSVALSGNTLFYVAPWHLFAFDATKGTLLWTGSFPNDYWGWGSPVVAGNTVLAPFYYPDTDSDHGGVAAYPVGGCGQPTCTPSWLSVLGADRISGVAVKGSTGYAIGSIRSGNSPPILVAFSLADGHLEWQLNDSDEYAQEAAYGVPSGVGIAGDLLWYGTTTGGVAAVPTAGCGGSVCSRVWFAKMTSAYGDFQPTVADGVVFAGGDKGVTAFAVPGKPSAVSPSAAADSTPPTVTFAGVPVATTASAATFSWHATDSGSGVLNADVVYRKAGYDGTFGGWVYPPSWQYTTASSVRLSLAPGDTYCVAVRARDASGNVSKWSSPHCIARVLDDRSLSASSAWTRGTASHYYLGTYTTTTRSSAALTLAGARADRVGVLAIECPKCGTLGVYLGSTLLSRIDLAHSTRVLRLVLLPRFSLRTATVTVRTLSSGLETTVDGLVATAT
ncbi:MAG: hypothetical protein QOD07_1957 [Frankiaceae bacterium]|jgi:hypothetical protein|nr:hypothetical protein [Frankiaceae bacterium]